MGSDQALEYGQQSKIIYDRLAVEFSLAHQLKDSVEAAYLRSNLIVKRKILMQDWVDYCSEAKS